MSLHTYDLQQIEQLELQTERLTLKVIGPELAPQVLDYLVRNRAFLSEWNAIVPEDFYTLAAQQVRMQADRDAIKAGRSLRFWLFKKEDRAFARTIGHLALSNIVRGAFQSCHLGYQLDEREINQGLITEALRCAIAFAFEQMKLHRIEANVMPRNQRSRRVVEKLGLTEEGLARRYLKINGVWEDHIHYVLLNAALE